MLKVIWKSTIFLDIGSMIIHTLAQIFLISMKLSEISSEHITNNQAVRNTLLERGIRPESLPPAEDVKKIERRLASDEKKSMKNPDSLN